jgi:hypothetical protein
MMRALKSFGAFWYDFVIGDDWQVAALIVAGLAVTALLTHVAGVNAWWLLPLCALGALAWSLRRATSGKSRLLPHPLEDLGGSEFRAGAGTRLRETEES